jgi:hypothetical protein
MITRKRDHCHPSYHLDSLLLVVCFQSTFSSSSHLNWIPLYSRVYSHYIRWLSLENEFFVQNSEKTAAKQPIPSNLLRIVSNLHFRFYVFAFLSLFSSIWSKVQLNQCPWNKKVRSSRVVTISLEMLICVMTMSREMSSLLPRRSGCNDCRNDVKGVVVKWPSNRDDNIFIVDSLRKRKGFCIESTIIGVYHDHDFKIA